MYPAEDEAPPEEGAEPPTVDENENRENFDAWLLDGASLGPGKISLVIQSWLSAGWAINNTATSSNVSDTNVAGVLLRATAPQHWLLRAGLLLVLHRPRRLLHPRRLETLLRVAVRHLHVHQVRRAPSRSLTPWSRP